MLVAGLRGQRMGRIRCEENEIEIVAQCPEYVHWLWMLTLKMAHFVRCELGIKHTVPELLHLECYQGLEKPKF